MLANNTDPHAWDHTPPPLPPHLVPSHPCCPTPACSCDIEAETGPAGPILVLRVAGEIDTITRPAVQTALSFALHRTPQALVVDLAGVGFCCVRGFELLADTAHHAQEAGVEYALSGLSGHLDRVFTLLWPQESFVRYRSAAAAVTSIRIDHTYRHA